VKFSQHASNTSKLYSFSSVFGHITSIALFLNWDFNFNLFIKIYVLFIVLMTSVIQYFDIKSS